MKAALIRALWAQRAQIRARWADLLHAERAVSPLANPDALAHLVDPTLDELLADFGKLKASRRHAHHPDIVCPCRRNPLLTYFACGLQATREMLIHAQAAMPALAPSERDSALRALDGTYRRIAHREIESFCSVCQFRQTSPRD